MSKISDIKLAVLTAAVWPDMDTVKKKLWVFLRSCEKFGVGLDRTFFYGIGRTFPGYRAMCLDLQVEYVRKWLLGSTYTHVLFTDSWDAMFTGGIEEIEGKYVSMGSPPMLVSAFHQLANVSDEEGQYPGCFDHSVGRNCYPNRGGYIAEIPVMVEMFERMLKLPRQTGDDCFNWYDAWAEGWFRPVLDSQCQIFKVSDDSCDVVDVDGSGVRLWDTATDTHPCVLHLSGGYTSQETGKDDRMVPWAERLGIL